MFSPTFFKLFKTDDSALDKLLSIHSILLRYSTNPIETTTDAKTEEPYISYQNLGTNLFWKRAHPLLIKN